MREDIEREEGGRSSIRLRDAASSREAGGCHPLPPNGFVPDDVLRRVSSTIMVKAAPGSGISGRQPPPPVGFFRLLTSTILFTLVSRRLNMSCETLFVHVVVSEATFVVRSVIFFSKPSTVPLRPADVWSAICLVRKRIKVLLIAWCKRNLSFK